MLLTDGKKLPIAMAIANTSLSAANSPLKASLKALTTEASKQATCKKHDDAKQSSEMKNNNKASENNANESDDDDSVFINENKPKKTNKTSAKHQPASTNASSVLLNVSSSSAKPVAPAAAQIHNSRDLNVPSETVVR